MIGTKNIINDFKNGNSLALLSDLRLTTGLESNFFNISSKNYHSACTAWIEE
jgi:hypothetical protein